VIEPVRHKIRRWRYEFDKLYSTGQGHVQGQPRVLLGERLGSLRPQIIDHPLVPFRAGISNAGLLKTASGYVAIAKNNTYCFCADHGIETAFGPQYKPPRAELLRVDLDDDLRVRALSPLRIVRDGERFEGTTDLREDARLTRIGDDVWCSVNLVPQGLQWDAVPAVGKLLDGAEELVARSVRTPPLKLPQKNWMPFSSGGGFFLQYSINPHVVWRVDPQTLAVVDRYSSWFVSPFFGPRGPFYRGGTPLVPYDGSLLGAAHSMVLSRGKRDYRTHFYVADARPPFKIRWFGRPVKLLRPERIQYVCGLVPRGDGFVVSYGMDDCDNVFGALSAKDISATLVRA